PRRPRNLGDRPSSFTRGTLESRVPPSLTGERYLSPGPSPCEERGIREVAPVIASALATAKPKQPKEFSLNHSMSRRPSLRLRLASRCEPMEGWVLREERWPHPLPPLHAMERGRERGVELRS